MVKEPPESTDDAGFPEMRTTSMWIFFLEEHQGSVSFLFSHNSWLCSHDVMTFSIVIQTHVCLCSCTREQKKRMIEWNIDWPLSCFSQHQHQIFFYSSKHPPSQSQHWQGDRLPRQARLPPRGHCEEQTRVHIRSDWTFPLQSRGWWGRHDLSLCLLFQQIPS